MDTYSTKLQSELETMRGVYEKAKARIDGTDTEWKVRKERLLLETFRAVRTFTADDPASKAVFIIGSVQAAVKELDAPRLIVADYETKRKRYADLCASEGKSAAQF